MLPEQFKAKGKIEEIWGDWDTLGIVQQFGVIPSMG